MFDSVFMMSNNMFDSVFMTLTTSCEASCIYSNNMFEVVDIS